MFRRIRLKKFTLHKYSIFYNTLNLFIMCQAIFIPIYFKATAAAQTVCKYKIKTANETPESAFKVSIAMLINPVKTFA